MSSPGLLVLCKEIVVVALDATRSITAKYVVLDASVGHGSMVGASKACTPEPEKVAGSVSVHSVLPGVLPLASFSVITRSVPAVVVAVMVSKSKPMELSV